MQNASDDLSRVIHCRRRLICAGGCDEGSLSTFGGGKDGVIELHQLHSRPWKCASLGEHDDAVGACYIAFHEVLYVVDSIVRHRCVPEVLSRIQKRKGEEGDILCRSC